MHNLTIYAIHYIVLHKSNVSGENIVQGGNYQMVVVRVNYTKSKWNMTLTLPFEAKVNFILTLNFVATPHLHLMGEDEIKINDKKQAG